MPYDETQDASSFGFDLDREDADGHTRRRVLGAAAVAAVAAGSGGLVGRALAASSSSADVLSFIAIQEGFGVTFLTEAIKRAPGSPSAQFLPVI